MRFVVLRVLLALLCALVVLVPASSHADDAPSQAQFGEENAMFSQVDPRTGAMAYSYAFDLPPARGLSGPSLGLRYNSSMGTEASPTAGASPCRPSSGARSRVFRALPRVESPSEASDMRSTGSRS